jgi:[histone H3]-lysine9 N-trimethyltransferase SUV39H
MYNKYGKTYLFQLDFYHLRGNDAGDDDDWQTKYVIDAYHAGNVRSMAFVK